MGVEPVTVMFVDVRARGLKTDAAAVRRVVKAHRLKQAMPDAMGLGALFSSGVGLHDYDANWQNYEALYLSKSEREAREAQGYVSANVVAARDPKEFAHLMFKDPLFSEDGEDMRRE